MVMSHCVPMDKLGPCNLKEVSVCVGGWVG